MSLDKTITITISFAAAVGILATAYVNVAGHLEKPKQSPAKSQINDEPPVEKYKQVESPKLIQVPETERPRVRSYPAPPKEL